MIRIPDYTMKYNFNFNGLIQREYSELLLTTDKEGDQRRSMSAMCPCEYMCVMIS